MYSPMELMICAASRALEDGKTAVVGTGVPCVVAMLAQRTHAPNLVVMFEAGGVAPILPSMPISVGDSRTFYRGLDRKSTRLNSSHQIISYAVFCLKKKKKTVTPYSSQTISCSLTKPHSPSYCTAS